MSRNLNRMTAAYSYLRMSRPEQARGDSLRRQLKGAREYATANGLTLVEDMRDIGVSAYKGKNSTEGILATFLAAVEAGAIAPGSVLIVENLDRLSRQQVPKALRLFLAILEGGIEIVTLSDGQRYTESSISDGPTQILISILALSRAHEESALKAQRIGEAWQKKREIAPGGVPMTAMAPAWLCLSPSRSEWHFRDGRDGIVRRIFEEASDGIGAMTIARRLTVEGVEPWGPRRRKSLPGPRGWHPSAIKKILANEAVIGVFQPHQIRNGKRVPSGPPIPDYFPTAIPADLFWRARAAIEGRKRGGAGRKGKRFSNLLAGLCVCGACGGPVHFVDKGAPPKGGRYFQCDHARRRAGCISGDLYRYDDVERGVFALLSDALFASVFAAERETSRLWQARAEELNAQIQALKRKQARYIAIFEDEGDVDDAASQRMRALRTEIQTASAERRRLLERIRAMDSVGKAQTSGESFEVAKDRLDAIDDLPSDAERYRARAEIAQALRRVIQKIVFHIDLATIEFADGEEKMIILGQRWCDPDTEQLLEERIRHVEAARGQAGSGHKK